MLRSNLCDYSDSYIVVKGIINIKATANADIDQKDDTFKNSAQFISCTSKINSTSLENVEYINIVMPMCNRLEHSQSYSMTSGSSCNYYRNEMDDVDANASDGK